MTSETRQTRTLIRTYKRRLRRLKGCLDIAQNELHQQRLRTAAGATPDRWYAHYDDEVDYYMREIRITDRILASLRLELTKQKQGWYWK